MKNFKYILFSLIVAGWWYFLYRIDPRTPFQAFFGAVFLTFPTLGIIIAVKEIVRRYKAGEPIITEQPPQPRKLPLWYRILSKIFR